MKRQKPKNGELVTSNLKLYNAWNSTKNRCYSKTSLLYPTYGGRGVTMAMEWRENYWAFKEWCELNGWGPKLQLCRKSPNEGYTPENCIWRTKKQAQLTKEGFGKVPYRGVCLHRVKYGENSYEKYMAQIYVNGKRHHLGLYKDPVEAALAYDLALVAFKQKNRPKNFPKGVQYHEGSPRELAREGVWEGLRRG